MLQRHMHHLHPSVVIRSPTVVVAQQQHLNPEYGGNDERQGADKEGELGEHHHCLEEQWNDNGFGRDQAHNYRVQQLRNLLLALRLKLDESMAVEFLTT